MLKEGNTIKTVENFTEVKLGEKNEVVSWYNYI